MAKITARLSSNGRVSTVIGHKGASRLEMKKARQDAFGNKSPHGITRAQLDKYKRDSQGRFARHF